MKKKDFVTLIMSVIGGILFALGMCMALLPEWGAMTQGVVMGVGAADHALGAPQDGRQARHRFQRQGDCHYALWRFHHSRFWCRDVHDDGLEHDGSRHRRWHRWNRPAAVPDSHLQGFEIRRTL